MDKFCTKCVEIKLVIQFHKSKNNKSGYSSWCKKCLSDYRKLDETKQKRREYWKQNRQHFIDHRRIKRQEAKDTAFKVLGSVCKSCSFVDIRALQIDHINGNGNQDRMTGNRAVFYKKVAEDNGKSYQLLCANCNWIKRYENKEL